MHCLYGALAATTENVQKNLKSRNLSWNSTVVNG